MGAQSNAGRVGVWGRSGSGKSAYTKARIAGRKRVIVFDPMDEYSSQGMKTVRHTSRNALDNVRLLMRKNWAGFRIAYVPPAGKEPQALSALSELLFAAQSAYRAGSSSAQITLVVEEMNLAFPVSGGVEKCPGFAHVCSRGRHYGVEVIGASQRIAEVSTRFRGNCTETVVLPQKGPRDISAAAHELGCNTSKVSALRNLQFIHEQNGTLQSGQISFKNRRPVAALLKGALKTS